MLCSEDCKSTATKYSLGDWCVAACILIVAACIDNEVNTRRSFFIDPNDPSLSYPKLNETVQTYLLILLAVVFPAVVFLVRALFDKSPTARTDINFTLLGFAVTMTTCYLVTVCIKQAVGYPRPNFFALCQYSDGACQSPNKSEVENAYQSFPSGHASISFAGLLYLSLYAAAITAPAPASQVKPTRIGITSHGNQLFRLILCFSPIILAIWISITRINDYYHSTADVVCGALLGIVCAYLSFKLYFSSSWPFPYNYINEDIEAPHGTARPSDRTDSA